MLDETAWLTICFLIFLWVFYRPIKNAILNFLDNRIKEITWEIDSANLTKVNSAKELEELRNSLKVIDIKHQEMIKAAEAEIEKHFLDRCNKFEKTIEFKQNSAKAHIEQLRKAAINELEQKFLDKVMNLVSSYFNEKKSATLDIAVVSTNILPRQKK